MLVPDPEKEQQDFIIEQEKEEIVETVESKEVALPDQPLADEDDFDLSHITHKEKSREDIIAEAEAAAVTVAGMNEITSIGGPVEYPKATFHANRPFVYVISEASSGVILFVGKFTGV